MRVPNKIFIFSFLFGVFSFSTRSDFVSENLNDTFETLLMTDSHETKISSEGELITSYFELFIIDKSAAELNKIIPRPWTFERLYAYFKSLECVELKLHILWVISAGRDERSVIFLMNMFQDINDYEEEIQKAVIEAIQKFVIVDTIDADAVLDEINNWWSKNKDRFANVVLPSIVNPNDLDLYDFVHWSRTREVYLRQNGGLSIRAAGLPELEAAISHLNELPRPWDFRTLHALYNQTDDLKTKESLIWVLAASRDPRSAKFLYNLFENLELQNPAIRNTIIFAIYNCLVLPTFYDGNLSNQISLWWENNKDLYINIQLPEGIED